MARLLGQDDSERMYRVISAETVGPAVRRIELAAPAIAVSRRPGQFVIVRVFDGGERIPLTIADHSDGTITLFVQAVGRTTQLLNSLEAGDQVADVVGPLGTPSRIDLYGHAVVIGGGLGTAIAYPVAAALREHGNRVTAIIGGRSRDQILLEAEFRSAGTDVQVCTEDGTYGETGLVTDLLRSLLDGSEPPDIVFTAGPVAMMRAVAEMTRRYGIHTEASLNPIMVDGTGMCGGCRVMVGGQTRFACVDGPEFDAHQVDFDLLERRNRAYRLFEAAKRDSLDRREIDRLLAGLRPVEQGTGS